MAPLSFAKSYDYIMVRRVSKFMVQRSTLGYETSSPATENRCRG